LQDRLKNEETASFDVTYTFKPFKISIDINAASVGNYTYFDSALTPLQSPRNLHFGYAGFAKTFTFGPLVYDVKVGLQLSDGQGIRNLPELLSFQTLFIKFKMFKGDLMMRTGLECFYTSAYFAEAYAPQIRRFYTQNQKEAGASPIFNAFLNAEVSRLQLFVQMRNVFEGSFGYNYYAADGFPFPDRAFKLGLRWVFLN
jgi:hypothetical protein